MQQMTTAQLKQVWKTQEPTTVWSDLECKACECDMAACCCHITCPTCNEDYVHCSCTDGWNDAKVWNVEGEV